MDKPSPMCRCRSWAHQLNAWSAAVRVISLLWQRHTACDGELRIGFCAGLVRLCGTQRQAVAAGQNGTLSVVVHRRKRTRADPDVDLAALTGAEVDALESDE